MPTYHFNGVAITVQKKIPEKLVSKFENYFVIPFINYQNKFSLNDWLVEFYLIEDPEDNSNKAMLGFDLDGKLATCYCFLEFVKNYPEAEIERVAFHEVCELLLAEISCEFDNYISVKKNRKIVHSVIRRLENFFFNGNKIQN